MGIWEEILSMTPARYDIRIFELLPLFIKAEIINKYIVVFGDELEISEYFYHYRRIWKDMKIRLVKNQYKSFEEKLEGIESDLAQD